MPLTCGHLLYPDEQMKIRVCVRDEHGIMQEVSTVTLTNHERDGLLEVFHTEGEASYLSYFHRLPPTHEE